MSTVNKLDEVVLHSNFNSSPIPRHTSYLINTALDFIANYDKLKSKLNADAKVALILDGVWFVLLRYATLKNIARSYTSTVDKSSCISFEKISDSINILNESSCPLQVSALQRPLTTHYEDYTPVPATISLTLPRELMERVLLLLDIEHILTCRLVNREFNKSIQSSMLLQYFLACRAAGVIDNPRSSLSYAERLEALGKREDAWRNLNPVFEMTIEVNHPPSSISTYGLTGGAYFLKDSNQGDLHYCRLPSSSQDSPRWIRIPGHGPGEGRPGNFVSFAIAVYEHDLIINVISSDIGNETGMQRHSLDLVLLKFSTGEYHPLARQHRIHIQRSSSARPWVIPRIVGDNLALVVHSQNGTCPDKLFIFDWKTGHKRLQHETTEDAYSDLVFVSPELLLVPNIMLSHFEIWHLPPSYPNSELPSQILSLQIPAVSPEYSIFNLGCHGESNPFLHSIPYFPPRPFFTSPENSIITINLIISSISPSVRRRRASYTLIMHRRALLDAIQKWTSPPLLEQIVLPTLLMNEVTVHKISDPDDGSVRLDAQSKLVSTMPHLRSSTRTRGSPTFSSQTSSTSPTSHMSVDSGFSSGSSTTLSMPQYSFPQVQWADWGPPISRWFQVDETQARWIMNSTGQRYAFSVPNDRNKLMVSVADFNPYNVRKNAEMMARLGRESKDDGSNGNNDDEGKEKGDEEEELEMLDHGGMFSEEVCMGLKCVVYPAPGDYDFDGVLMDEERLLGLKCNHRGRVESVKVLYFG
ncbi:hypothetical protein M378DRAFT_160889 [Amanita muscaria Koide BX008]|uniref:F-box domain-containing protein n=1 Tax=Amanita muscaria (strain Koide BX008) TaxID=946122 RepID=A0A0C2XAT0_AMAMK|nr:hypothetical protein M378DRAFT_160889 [Amanita muscaria Koide BX008]